MSKITTALLLVFVIEVSLVFFSGTDYAKTSLYSFLINPELFSSSAFYVIMFGILIAAYGSVVVPSAFYQINQWALFGIAGIAIITFGINIAHLHTFINGQLIGIFSHVQVGGLIATLIIAPLAIFYLVAVIEWTRQN
ncbi:MAG: hypothetical protein ACOC56_02520 [Atribacterota bacterium]